MVTLEQIRLLESKISRAIEFVARLTEEKARLMQQNEELRETITALRETIEALKEEKNRVEEGIVSALGKLNQFEDAMERTLGYTGDDGNAASGNDDGATDNGNDDASASFAEESPPEEDLPASAYTVDEEIEDTIEEDADKSGDSGEAELDIF